MFSDFHVKKVKMTVNLNSKDIKRRILWNDYIPSGSHVPSLNTFKNQTS